MRGKEFLARLHDEVLIGDGALGTFLAEQGVGRDTVCERLNETHPDLIRSVHAAYLAAGAQVLETNTFGANRTKLSHAHDPEEVVRLNRLGVQLARGVAGTNAYVAGAIGPLAEPHRGTAPLSDDDIRDAFREPILTLADAGADLLLLETFTDLRQLLIALKTAKQLVDLPVVCQLAYHEHGYTMHGVGVRQAWEALVQAGADVIGANCGRGVRCVMNAVKILVSQSDCFVSAFPNAGLPEYVDGRYRFGAELPYQIRLAVQMVEAGVNLIGGCCGTTPAYVAAISEQLKGRRPAPRLRVTPREITEALVSGATTDTPLPPPPGSLLYEHYRPDGSPVRPHRPLVVVELDPPRGLNYEPILRRAQQLRDMGVDAITMADNPVATLHMGNLALATIVQREADVPVILHLTCRDHNLLGLQSRLLEAHALGVHHILALTGDPAKVGDSPGATSVYDMQSFGLVELIDKFNRGVNHGGLSIGRPTTFTIGVAFNPNGSQRHLAHHVERLRKKVRHGAHFAMTQPIYDPHRFHEMMAATRELKIPILVGIMPLLSERNAEFLHNEVPGIVLTDAVRTRMKGLTGKDGKREGLRICHELIDGMVHSADGFYLIPPQRSTEMAIDLVAHIRQQIAVPHTSA